MKILVADDDLVARCMLEAILQSWGYHVVSAASGNEAWAAFQEAQPPRLALLDWMMPGLTGPELCRKVRELAPPEPPYLVLLTAKGERKEIIEGLEAGADDYIRKPYDCDELRARLNVGERILSLQAAMVGYGKLRGVIEMAGAVCHELNQPLQAVSLYSELLLDNLTDTDPNYLSMRNVQQAVDRIATLTRQIMQISRYEGKDYLNTRIVDIHKSSEQAA